MDAVSTTNLESIARRLTELIKLQSEPFNKPLQDKKTGVELDLDPKTKSPEQSIREQIALIQQENSLLEQGVGLEDARTIAK